MLVLRQNLPAGPSFGDPVNTYPDNGFIVSWEYEVLVDDITSDGRPTKSTETYRQDVWFAVYLEAEAYYEAFFVSLQVANPSVVFAQNEIKFQSNVWNMISSDPNLSVSLVWGPAETIKKDWFQVQK